MERLRVALAVAALVVAAYAVLRATARPEPYATLARPAAGAQPVPLRPAVVAMSEPPDPAGPRDAPAPGALWAAFRRLDRARAAGYADPLAADPDAWAARSCACHAEDARRLRDLAARGLRLRGHRATVTAFALVRAGPARAVLLVSDRLAPYAAVGRSGAVAARWPGSPLRRWRVTLVRDSGRWLLGAVARAP